MEFVSIMSTKFKNIHLAPENEEDDIYEGYDDFQLDVSHVTRENTVLYIYQQELEDDPEFLRVVATQHGRNKRPPLPTTGMGQPLRAHKTGVYTRYPCIHTIRITYILNAHTHIFVYRFVLEHKWVELD